MVGRKRVNPGLDIGEVLLDQRRPVRIQALVEARIGPRLRLRALALLPPNLFGKPVPSDIFESLFRMRPINIFGHGMQTG